MTLVNDVLTQTAYICLTYLQYMSILIQNDINQNQQFRKWIVMPIELKSKLANWNGRRLSFSTHNKS